MKKEIKVIFIILTLAVVAFLISLYKKGIDSQNMAFKSKLLKFPGQSVCPEKPNCVSSFENQDGEFYVGPKEYSQNPIMNLKVPGNCKLVSDNSFHRHYICQSSFFGFVDDLEFFYQEGKLYFLSQSRVGYSDLGANKKRVELVKEIN